MVPPGAVSERIMRSNEYHRYVILKILKIYICEVWTHVPDLERTATHGDKMADPAVKEKRWYQQWRHT
eukprot:SAG22_NODE_10008_length_558_cov_33.407407_2_plen_67_part_01